MSDSAIKVVPLTESLRPGFTRLLRHAWMQNWDDSLAEEIIDWRYFNRPNGDTWIVSHGDECVGVLDSMPRPHLLHGKRIIVRETADWFVLPQYRVGFGLTLLNRVKACGEPVLVIGGSANTLEVLPKFRFKLVQMARYYVLPVTARGLLANTLRKWKFREELAKIMPSVPIPLGVRHRVCKQAGCDVRLMPSRIESIPVPERAGLVQTIEPWHWEWLARMPRLMAIPVGLTFVRGDTVLGCSISQLEPSVTGLDARILHFQSSEPITEWIVAATARYLRDCGAQFIRCCVSTPEKFAALESIGFVSSQRVPIHWFSRDLPPPSSIDAGYLRGDDAIPWQALQSRQLQRIETRHAQQSFSTSSKLQPHVAAAQARSQPAL